MSTPVFDEDLLLCPVTLDDVATPTAPAHFFSICGHKVSAEAAESLRRLAQERAPGAMAQCPKCTQSSEIRVDHDFTALVLAARAMFNAAKASAERSNNVSVAENETATVAPRTTSDDRTKSSSPTSETAAAPAASGEPPAAVVAVGGAAFAPRSGGASMQANPFAAGAHSTSSAFVPRSLTASSNPFSAAASASSTSSSFAAQAAVSRVRQSVRPNPFATGSGGAVNPFAAGASTKSSINSSSNNNIASAAAASAAVAPGASPDSDRVVRVLLDVPTGGLSAAWTSQTTAASATAASSSSSTRNASSSSVAAAPALSSSRLLDICDGAGISNSQVSEWLGYCGKNGARDVEVFRSGRSNGIDSRRDSLVENMRQRGILPVS